MVEDVLSIVSGMAIQEVRPTVAVTTYTSHYNYTDSSNTQVRVNIPMDGFAKAQ